jgi:hypothetical protein
LAARGVRGIIFDYVDVSGEEGPQRMRARHRSVPIVWEGRLHEGLDQDTIPLDARRIVERSEGVFWRHRSPAKSGRHVRNLRVIERWIAEEPGDPRPHAMLGEFRLRFEDDRMAAADSFERYLDLRGSTLSNLEDRRAAVAQFRTDGQAAWEPLVFRILGRPFASVGVRTRGEKEAGLTRQQRRALARQREKAQRRVKQIARKSKNEELSDDYIEAA